jgi:cysteine-S-conjugate beta-lyase
LAEGGVKVKGMWAENPVKEETALLHWGRVACDLPQTVGPPIHRGSTVLFEDIDSLFDTSRVTYGRQGLTTQLALRTALIELEKGEDAFLYPSGLSALTATMLALLNTGDEVLLVDSVYNPTRRFASATLQNYGIKARFFEPSIDVATLGTMISPATRLIVLESPGSLTFEVLDIPAIAAMAREHGIFTMIDNTWAAGLLFKPLLHGVDVSVQALTKYVGGHSDVFMGTAIATGPVLKKLKQSYKDIGWSVSPDDAYQVLRGLRTLSTRITRHGESATKVASWLQTRPEVAEVLCPALPGARGHKLWCRDFSGTCGLFGVILKPCSTAAVVSMLSSLRLFGIGYSWGGFESLVIAADPQLEARSFPPHLDGPLVRLHVGLENPADLIGDLQTAFQSIAA